jgi:hypothetical protein
VCWQAHSVLLPGATLYIRSDQSARLRLQSLENTGFLGRIRQVGVNC